LLFILHPALCGDKVRDDDKGGKSNSMKEVRRE
jgi:hypothetical protein